MATDLATTALSTDHDAIFVNEDWSVLPDGLEHRANGYFIARETLAARRDGLWEWPLHLAEKSWCRPRLLREAFAAALSRFGIAADEQLARSFAVGFGIGAAPAAPKDFVRLGEVRLGEVLPVRSRPATSRETGRRRVAA